MITDLNRKFEYRLECLRIAKDTLENAYLCKLKVADRKYSESERIQISRGKIDLIELALPEVPTPAQILELADHYLAFVDPKNELFK